MIEFGLKLSKKEQEEAERWGGYHEEDWQEEKDLHYSEKVDHGERSIGNDERHRRHFRKELDE